MTAPKYIVSVFVCSLFVVLFYSSFNIQVLKAPLMMKSEHFAVNTFRSTNFLLAFSGNESSKFYPVRKECIAHQQYDSYTYFPEEDLDFLKTEEGKEYKTILAWHYAYGPNFGFGFGRKPFQTGCCVEPRCFITGKRDVIPVEDFDAVVIHFRGLKKLPPKRSGHQRYVFYEREPPTLSSQNAETYEDVFNWTMTFRKDSDIFAGYGYVFPKKDLGMPETRLYHRTNITKQLSLKKRTMMAAWFVSHCSTHSKREKFVKKLQKYIKVDIYGKCGPLKCKNGSPNGNCHKMLEKKYKFYLSFENSICQDYITEKFFLLLQYDILPVVYGGGDYKSIAPPHSYVDSRDFRGAKELANYLLYLNHNDTAYSEYFRWKDTYNVMSVGFPHIAMHFCALCYKLHHDNEKYKSYHDLKGWWNVGAKCKMG